MKTYREFFGETFPDDYKHLIESLGAEVLFEKHEGDYQGDSHYILKNGNEYGILNHAYGSCSGCDHFESCYNEKDYENLRVILNNSIIWKPSVSELYNFIANRDWETQAGYHTGLGKEFVIESLDYLKLLVFANEFHKKLGE